MYGEGKMKDISMDAELMKCQSQRTKAMKTMLKLPAQKKIIDQINKRRKQPMKVQTSESLWANIHKKRERIKRGSGEKMRKVGDKGAPTPAQMKRAKGESVTEEMKCPPCNSRPCRLIQRTEMQQSRTTITEAFEC